MNLPGRTTPQPLISKTFIKWNAVLRKLWERFPFEIPGKHRFISSQVQQIPQQRYCSLSLLGIGAKKLYKNYVCIAHRHPSQWRRQGVCGILNNRVKRWTVDLFFSSISWLVLNCFVDFKSFKARILRLRQFKIKGNTFLLLYDEHKKNVWIIRECLITKIMGESHFA